MLIICLPEPGPLDPNSPQHLISLEAESYYTPKTGLRAADSLWKFCKLGLFSVSYNN